MKKLTFILALIVVLFSFCKKDSNTDPKPNPTANSGKIVFTIDNGSQNVCVINSITIGSQANSNNKSFQLEALTTTDASTSQSILISIIHKFTLDTNTYYMPGNTDALDVNFGNNMSYGYHLSGNMYVFNNVACDSFYQGNANHGLNCKLKITSINTTQKTISGNFMGELCKGKGEYYNLKGTFTDVTYLYF